jgi:hypothetical protein
MNYNITKNKTESKPKNQNTKESQNTRERTKKNRGTLQIEQQYLGFDKQLAVKKKKKKKNSHLIATYLPTYIISYIPLQRQTVKKKKGERFTSKLHSVSLLSPAKLSIYHRTKIRIRISHSTTAEEDQGGE